VKLEWIISEATPVELWPCDFSYLEGREWAVRKLLIWDMNRAGDGCQGEVDYLGEFDCGYDSGVDCLDCLFGEHDGLLDPRLTEEERAALDEEVGE
jgi:hypothetical protein